MQPLADDMLQTDIAEVPALLLLHRQVFLNGADQLTAQLDLPQIILVQVSQMHAHAAADVAAHDGRRYIARGGIPDRRSADAGSDTYMHIRRIAHVFNIRNLQIVVGHLQYLVIERAEQLLTGIDLEVAARKGYLMFIAGLKLRLLLSIHKSVTPFHLFKI
ncbi:hypothetical protein D3C73_1309700 [compost metagenome]